MTREDLEKATNPVTFRPFKLRIVGELTYEISHREQLWLHPYSRTSFTVALRDGSTHHLNLNLVSALIFPADEQGGQAA